MTFVFANCQHPTYHFNCWLAFALPAFASWQALRVSALKRFVVVFYAPSSLMTGFSVGHHSLANLLVYLVLADLMMDFESLKEVCHSRNRTRLRIGCCCLFSVTPNLESLNDSFTRKTYSTHFHSFVLQLVFLGHALDLGAIFISLNSENADLLHSGFRDCSHPNLFSGPYFLHLAEL